MLVSNSALDRWFLIKLALFNFTSSWLSKGSTGRGEWRHGLVWTGPAHVILVVLSAGPFWFIYRHSRWRDGKPMKSSVYFCLIDFHLDVTGVRHGRVVTSRPDMNKAETHGFDWSKYLVLFAYRENRWCVGKSVSSKLYRNQPQCACEGSKGGNWLHDQAPFGSTLGMGRGEYEEALNAARIATIHHPSIASND